MQGDIKKQSAWDRDLYRDKKKDYYPTELENVRLLSQLFEFPKDSEVCVLEPCIGEGTAVIGITRRMENSNIKIFGVELDEERYLSCRRNELIDYVVHSDFLQGVKISNKTFSFAFVNPPYGQGMIESFIKSFTRKIDPYMKADAVVVLVIPYYTFAEDNTYASIIANRYNVEGLYKFHEPEFSRFRQIAIICRKKKENTQNPELANWLKEKCSDAANIELIPINPPETKISVKPSNSDEVKVFEGDQVDMDDLRSLPHKTQLYKWLYDNTKVVGNILRLPRPGIIPGLDHLFLLAVSGYSEGVMGKRENKDMHLQRGNIITSIKRFHEKLPNGKVIEKIKQFKKSKLIILENDGTFTELES